MKVCELYESVVKLGFEDSLEDISAFFHAANRAMLQINAHRPLTSILEIYHRVPENLAIGATFNIIEHTDEDIIFEASGPVKAYSFEVLGYGEYRIEVFTGGEWLPRGGETFGTSVFTRCYGFIDPDGEFTQDPVRIRFIGKEYAYKIREVALWGVIYSPNKEDIPSFEEYVRYDLKILSPDFLELSDVPMEEKYARLVGDYIIEDGHVLRLPRSAAAEIKIKYRRVPRRLVYVDTVTKDDTEIELDAELSELLPILTAVYIWLDEGDAKAGTYLELYRERIAEIDARHRSYEPRQYGSVNNW